MEILQNPNIELENWRIDDYINKQYLCDVLRSKNRIPNYFILDYNFEDYDWHSKQLSVIDDKENVIRLKTYLKKKKELVDLVNKQAVIEFDIDLAKKKLLFKLKYYFHRNADTKELRRKKAIVLETFSYEEFRNLILYVGYGDHNESYSYANRKYFSEIYQIYYLKANTPEELIFLYTNTPDFVFEEMTLDNKKVMQHLLTLIEYDDEGFFSGLRDGSSALVNVFKAFSTPGFVMNVFKQKPQLCNRIYYNLDNVSFIDGKPQSNRLIFAGIMRAFALNIKIKGDVPTFKMSKGFRVNTKVTELAGKILGIFGQSDEATFFLQQEKLVATKPKIVAKEQDPNQTKEEYAGVDEGKQYFPLDMVYLEEEFEGITTITKVPAIYVKALADAENWAIINDRIRIAANIAAIILGVGTLATTGNPYLILAAAAELSLAIPDLTIRAFREEVKKLTGGEQFLNSWDLIYGVGGAIVAAPQLILSVYKGIFVLLPQAAKNVQQGLKASAISLFLDLNAGRFERSQLKFLETTEWVKATGGSFDNVSAMWLEKIGAGFIEIANNTGKATKQEYMFVYRGLPVAKGNKYVKNYNDLILKVKKASYSEGKLIETLEEAFDDTWKYFDKEGASGRKYETKDLERIFTEGSRKNLEKNVKYLNQKERDVYEIFVQYDKIVDAKGNLVDTNGSISVLEDGFPMETNYAIFVMSEDGKIYLSKNREFGKFHHSSFLRGKPISAGGEIIIEKGVIKEINNASGHYKPNSQLVEENMIKELNYRGYFNIENPKENINFKSEF